LAGCHGRLVRPCESRDAARADQPPVAPRNARPVRTTLRGPPPRVNRPTLDRGPVAVYHSHNLPTDGPPRPFPPDNPGPRPGLA